MPTAERRAVSSSGGGKFEEIWALSDPPSCASVSGSERGRAVNKLRAAPADTTHATRVCSGPVFRPVAALSVARWQSVPYVAESEANPLPATSSAGFSSSNSSPWQSPVAGWPAGRAPEAASSARQPRGRPGAGPDRRREARPRQPRDWPGRGPQGASGRLPGSVFAIPGPRDLGLLAQQLVIQLVRQSRLEVRTPSAPEERPPDNSGGLFVVMHFFKRSGRYRPLPDGRDSRESI
jgi:hypothetical protein